MKRFAVAVTLGVLFLSACSKSTAPGDSTTTASCEPSGTAIKLTAANSAFDKKCLAVQAGSGFTVEVSNSDSEAHDFSILSKKGGAVLFNGQTQLVNGNATVTYNVEAQTAGSYYFVCDLHPDDMNGTFLVKA